MKPSFAATLLSALFYVQCSLGVVGVLAVLIKDRPFAAAPAVDAVATAAIR